MNPEEAKTGLQVKMHPAHLFFASCSKRVWLSNTSWWQVLGTTAKMSFEIPVSLNQGAPAPLLSPAFLLMQTLAGR